MPPVTALIQKLKRARELKGSRESLLTDLINGGMYMSLRSLCRWEYGDAVPHKDMYIRINQALDKIIDNSKPSNNGTKHP